jgi:hypothetical protein
MPSAAEGFGEPGLGFPENTVAAACSRAPEARGAGPARASKWLGGRDSNPDSQIQSLESYRWTTPQRFIVPHRDRRGHFR